VKGLSERGRLLAILTGMVLAMFAYGSAGAGPYRALIIGNNYSGLPMGGGQLENAHADADHIADLLQRIGFGEGDAKAIIVKKDASLVDIYELWQQALDETDAGGVVVFFFSGHGFQDRNANYLLQDGARVPPSSNPKVLEGQYVRLDAIMDSFIEARQSKNIVGVFIIDACREDVFKPAGTRAIGAARGLAPVRMPNDSETFVLFATAPGQYAYDALAAGEGGKGSVFTRNLVAHFQVMQRGQIGKEGLADMAQDVRDLVVALSRASGKSQVPTYYDQLAQRRNIFGAPIPRRTVSEEEEHLQKLATAPITVASATPAVRKVGDVFSDACPDCPQMVVIPAGSFQQGSPDTEQGRNKNEGRQRLVTLATDFAISKFAITNQQWNICVKEGGCVGYRGFGWQNLPKTGYAWLDQFIPDAYRPNKPVANVSWRDAQAYVDWLSKKTGQAYRLPSESEWEYAARAQSKGPYHFSGKSKRDDLVEICQYANGADVSLRAFRGANTRCADDYARETAPVGSYKPNDFGLFDMGGNVWQWTADCWHDDYRGAPVDGAAWTDDKTTCRRVARGGSWRSGPNAMRSAARNAFGQDHTRGTLGFRVARTMR
jgi:formylglycine-generating enzyme required for sulfatase activity